MAEWMQVNRPCLWIQQSHSWCAACRQLNVSPITLVERRSLQCNQSGTTVSFRLHVNQVVSYHLNSIIYSWSVTKCVWWMLLQGCYAVLENNFLYPLKNWQPMESLHWLSVLQRMCFKLCHDDVQSDARIGTCLSELCEPDNSHVRTRSSVRGDLAIPRTKTKFGERAFVVAGQIGNHTHRAFHWHHDLWPWMTLNRPSVRSLQLQSNISITVYGMQQHRADNTFHRTYFLFSMRC